MHHPGSESTLITTGVKWEKGDVHVILQRGVKQSVFHLREGEVHMLEHYLKQYKKSTSQALI